MSHVHFSSAKGVDLSWVDSQVRYEGAVEEAMEGEGKGQSGGEEEKVPVLHGLPLTKVFVTADNRMFICGMML